jgi:PAS domain-containing protein
MSAAASGVTSIYREVLGADFDRLHPQIQRRFGLTSGDGLAACGRGVMSKVWHGAFYTLPFLYLGTWRRIMFPESGRDIPFTIENYAFVDPFGRETVTWVRTFQTRRRRRFDAYMIYAASRKRIVDYLGSHEHLAVDIDISVDANGGLRLRSGEQRFYEGPAGFRFPSALAGVADVCEWFDDADGRFHIEVNVVNPRFGPLFGYTGTFEVEWIHTTETPAHLLPRRYERRE